MRNLVYIIFVDILYVVKDLWLKLIYTYKYWFISHKISTTNDTVYVIVSDKYIVNMEGKYGTYVRCTL